MFQKAVTLEELNIMKQKKERKIVVNKRKRSAREMGMRRVKVLQEYSDRAKEIVTASIQLP